MHDFDLIVTLAASFIAALTLGYAAHRLGWSPIVGYLLAGILVGPHTPGFVADRGLATQLSEVGVILLMFGVGLHFHLEDLLAVRKIALAGAITQSLAATLLTATVFHSFGWAWSAGVVFGLALSVASTVVLIRVLTEAGALDGPTGRIAVGWLVVEDIFTVFFLVLLPVVFRAPDAAGPGLPIALTVAAVKLAVFIGFVLIGGSRLVPWVLNKIADTRSRELFTLGVLAMALGIAVGAARFFDVSMALGAFLAGMIVGESDFSARAGAEALPMRDAFAVMFFLSTGMLFDPMQAVQSPLPIAAALGIVLIGKPLAAVAIVAILGYSSRTGLGVGLALAQIGEFSFLLANLGTSLGALPKDATNPLVAAAMISIMLNPLLYRAAPAIENFLKRHPALWRAMNRREARENARHEPAPAPQGPSAVIVGYGPTGQMVWRILQQRGVEPSVIEMNIGAHRSLRGAGHRSVYGDANRREVLEEAGVARASSLILSASGASLAAEAIRIARDLNPRIHVLARADFLRDAGALRAAGADEVFSGEGEVAIAIGDSILKRLGASPEDRDEARTRIRARLNA